MRKIALFLIVITAFAWTQQTAARPRKKKNTGVVTIADPVFLDYCVRGVEKEGRLLGGWDRLQQFGNEDGLLQVQELAKATEIDLFDAGVEGVSRLDGLEYFPALRELNLFYNAKITSIDLSHNPQLTSFRCAHSGLRSVDVTSNRKLKFLSVYETKITRVDLSRNPDLIGFDCSNTDFTSIDLSKNKELYDLDCYYCPKLRSLDLTHNRELGFLVCYSAALTSLDVSHNPELYYLDCGHNKIESLDLTHNLKLNSLDCAFTLIRELDISANRSLEDLDCTGCDKLERLYVWWGEGDEVPLKEFLLPPWVEIVYK